jgi:hypothetical protein
VLTFVSLENQRVTVTERVAGAAHPAGSRLEEKGQAARQFAGGNARDQPVLLTASGQVLVPHLKNLPTA